MKKRILSFFLVAAMLLTCVPALAAGELALVSSTTLTGNAGDIVTVPVDIANNTNGFNTFRILLTYDKDVLTPLPANPTSEQGESGFDTTGSVLSGMYANEAYEGLGNVVAVNYAAATNTNANGRLFAYKFRINDSVSGRQTTNIDIAAHSMTQMDGINVIDLEPQAAQATVSINPEYVEQLNVSITGTEDKTYNQKPQGVTVKLTKVSDGIDVTNTVSHEVLYNGSKTVPTDAGDYAVSVNITDDAYQIAGGSATASMKIKPVEITISATDKEKYVGQEDPELEYSQNGTVYPGDGQIIVDLERTGTDEPGVYDIVAKTLTAPSDNYTLIFEKGTFTVHAQKTQNVVVAGIPDSVTYGDAPIAVTVTPDPEANLSEYSVLSSDENVLKYEDGKLSVVGAGETDITVSVAGNVEYAAYTYEKHVVVNPMTVTVKADDKQMRVGEAVPELTYTFSDNVEQDDFTGALAHNGGDNPTAGIYDITQGTLALKDSKNYKMEFTGAKLTVTDKLLQNVTITGVPDAATYGDAPYPITVTPDPEANLNDVTYTWKEDSAAQFADGQIVILKAGTAVLYVSIAGNADYAPFTKTLEFEVAPRQVTVTVTPNQAKRVGTDDPESFAYTYEPADVLVGEDTFSGALEREPGEEVGTYPINIGTLTLGPNYEITFVGAEFEITEKTPQQITLDPIADKTYGDAPFTVTAKPDPNTNLTDFRYYSSNPEVATVDEMTGEVTIVAGGITNITAKEMGNDEYAVSEATQMLTVHKKDLTVGVTSEIITYGDAYTPEITYDGFVNGEAASALTKQPVIQGLPEKLVVGSYTMTPAEAESNKYAFIYTTGLLTVNARDVVIEGLSVFDKAYDGTVDGVLNTANATVSGQVAGDDITIDTTNATVAFASAEIGEGIAVTVTGLAIAGADAANYNLTSTEAELTGNIKESVTAADIAAQITALAPLAKDSQTVRLPEVPAGYTIALESSDNEDVITASGEINPVTEDTTVMLTFRITSETDETDTAVTSGIPVTVYKSSTVTITVEAGAGGSVTGGGVYLINDTVRLTASPGSGYEVEGFYEGDTKLVKQNFYEFKATRDMHIRVEFIPLAGGSSGSSSGSSTTVYTPKASKNSGQVYKGTVIELSTFTSGADIYYTTDGTTPTTSSTLYTDGIRIMEKTTIKAIAVKNGKKSNTLSVTYTVRFAEASFKENANEIRYMESATATTFEPDRSATRYEVIEALYNLMDIEESPVTNTYSDLDSAHREMVEAFASTAILDGYPNGTFGGNNGITRAEFVKMLALALELDVEADGKGDSEYDDVSDDFWGLSYINALSKYNYVIGDPDGNFRPDDNVTRAEVVTVLNRIVDSDNEIGEPRYEDLAEEHWAYEYIMSADIVKE